ncbi:MAG: hypothetical protein AB7L94_11120, partial [Kofleriaceae bacterium]
SITRSGATFTPTEGALAHFVQWRDTRGDTVLEMLILDGSTEVEVPALVALPSTGITTGGVQAIGADFDLDDFSLDDDRRLLWGLAGQPADLQ